MPVRSDNDNVLLHVLLAPVYLLLFVGTLVATLAMGIASIVLAPIVAIGVGIYDSVNGKK